MFDLQLWCNIIFYEHCTLRRTVHCQICLILKAESSSSDLIISTIVAELIKS